MRGIKLRFSKQLNRGNILSKKEENIKRKKIEIEELYECLLAFQPKNLGVISSGATLCFMHYEPALKNNSYPSEDPKYETSIFSYLYLINV